MLGYTVSQATVSRYLPAPGRRPTQSWRSFFAIKPVRLASIPRRSHGDTRACIFGPTGPSSCDPRLRRLRRSVLGSGAALDAKRPPRTLEESVCAPPSASEPLCTECPSARRGICGLQQARSNRLPIAVAVRSPPSEARASPRPRSCANQGVAFCVDRVLRSHNLPPRRSRPVFGRRLSQSASLAVCRVLR